MNQNYFAYCFWGFSVVILKNALYIYIYIYLERIYIYWATYSVSAFARTKCHHSMYRNPCFPNYTLCLGWISRLCEIYQNHLTFDLHAAMPTRGQKLFCCCFPPSLKGHHITNNPKNLVFIIAFLGTLSVGAHSMYVQLFICSGEKLVWRQMCWPNDSCLNDFTIEEAEG